MSDNSAIEWTDATWNVLLGCTKVSPGCDGCYAITNARIRESNPNPKVAIPYAGLVHRTDAGLDWTGQVNLLEERLDQPLKWKRPRRIFVNAQSDLFHDEVDYLFLTKVFAIMALAPRHTFQILTKRHARMHSVLNRSNFKRDIHLTAQLISGAEIDDIPWPLPNVWLGVSVENQKWADIRIPALLQTPAAVRWLSCEPLLGPVDLTMSQQGPTYWLTGRPRWGTPEPTGPRGIPMSALIVDPSIDWVVVGGESGHAARAMHPAWARSLRDQCNIAGTPYLFKQWGEWGPAPWKVTRLEGESDAAYKARAEAIGATHAHTHNPIGESLYHLYEPSHKPWSLERGGLGPDHIVAPIRRWGKKKAGRELDGRTWDEYPAVSS